MLNDNKIFRNSYCDAFDAIDSLGTYIAANRTDPFTISILEFKRKIAWSVTQNFYRSIDEMLHFNIPIAVAPSHEEGYGESGIRELALMLAKNNRIDATKCLRRKHFVPPNSSGERGFKQLVSCSSIEVVQPELIRNKYVLLLDDVSATGHTFRHCKQLLMAAGATDVKCFCLGKTIHK